MQSPKAAAPISATRVLMLVPVILAIQLTLMVGLALGGAAIHTFYRDVNQVVPVLLQIWMFATPIAYPSSLIQNPVLRTIYGLNPMAGVVEGFRWALTGSGDAPGPMLIVSFVIIVVLLASGLVFFRNTERTFADII